MWAAKTSRFSEVFVEIQIAPTTVFCFTFRKSETLGAFKALEEGLLERLDSKTLKLVKEGRLVRRKSSPTLRKEVSAESCLSLN